LRTFLNFLKIAELKQSEVEVRHQRCWKPSLLLEFNLLLSERWL
jgi:hypothetical protein